MTIALHPVTPSFAAEVGDVDLSMPLSAEDLAAIKAAFWKYAVLIFPDQTLTPGQHAGFAEAFGPLEVDRVLDPKVSHRATVSDVANTCEQAGVSIPT